MPELSAGVREAQERLFSWEALIVAGAGVALPGPGRQYEQQPRVGECSHGVALGGLEHRGKPRSSDRARDD